ncbi:MAG: YggS family pyridoxal phosphate-dependent enzyme [Chitinophagaceae bacterium]|nr:YggS family pyridoxal phosphate-dependent enzyme [Chitinophagaceae bacterium]
MAVNKEAYQQIQSFLQEKNVQLVAVSKTKPVEEIAALYQLGQRDFGENYVQEMVGKSKMLPSDVRWHFIGHLQTNKVKLIASFVQLIHGVDSLKLLKEINKQAAKAGRVIDCLLQVHIATEETKFGLDKEEVEQIMSTLKTMPLSNVNIRGLMGMASLTADERQIKKEFDDLKSLFDSVEGVDILSMGMSGDYQIAIGSGSNMVRIGSLLFGQRDKK